MSYLRSIVLSMLHAWLRKQKAYVPTLLRNWAVFIPTQIINFAIVPHHLRFFVVGVVSLFWSAFTTHRLFCFL